MGEATDRRADLAGVAPSDAAGSPWSGDTGQRFDTLGWLGRASRSRALCLGAPVLLYAWTLSAPFVFDDLHLILKAERSLRGESDRPGLFRFAATEDERRALVDRGTLPWWTAEGGRFAFVRPLTEAWFLLDTKLFGRNAGGHRLTGLAWFGAALWAARALYMAVGGDERRANLSAFFLGVSQCASGAAAFVSSRGDTFVIIGASLSAAAYVRSLRRPSLFWVFTAGGAYLAALASKETALALLPLVIGHAILTRQHRRSPARFWVPLLITVVTVAYGAWYLSRLPARIPGAADAQAVGPLFRGLTETLGLYLSVWMLGIPIQLVRGGDPQGVGVVAVLGALAAAGVAILFRRYRLGAPGWVFFLAWQACFLGLALLTLAEPRALCAATVGWAFILTTIVFPADSVRRPPKWLRHGLTLSNGLVSIGCAVGGVVLSTRTELAARDRITAYLGGRALRSGDAVVVRQPADDLEIAFGGDRLEFVSGVRGASLLFLTPAGANPTVERIDDHTLLLRSDSPRLFQSALHQLVLPRGWQPAVGRAFVNRVFAAEIAELTGGRVSAIRFRFAEPLGSPRWRFFPPLPER